MPFSSALRDVPAAPDPQAGWTTTSGRPEIVLFDFVKRLLAALDSYKAALNETGTQSVTVAQLPSAVGKTGVRYMVTDATATTFWSVVVGGGANIVPVVSDGTNWKIG